MTNGYDVQVGPSTAVPIASVRARVALDHIPDAFREPLGKVWAFLRTHPELKKDAHNVFLYHHATFDNGVIDIDFGVQVVSAFPGEGEVACTALPAGVAASVVHRGPYDGLGAAHGAIHAWMKEHGCNSPLSWEIYGDWSEDPAKLETTVFYLLD